MRVKRRITAPEFEALRPLLAHLSAARVDAARAALVDGQTMQSIADLQGWTRQAVWDTVGAVWRVHERYCASQAAAATATALLPPGWMKREVVAPAHLFPVFQQMIADAMSTADAATPTPRT